MSKTKKDIMDALLEEEQKNSNETHLEIIATSNDLMILGEYCPWNSGFKPEVREAAHLRLNKDMKELLDERDNIDYLIKIYDNLYWRVPEHRFRIANRLKDLFKKFETIEDFRHILKKKSGMSSWEEEDHPDIHIVVSEKAAELICLDSRNKSFIFLLTEMKKLPILAGARSIVTELMPAALKNEHDLKKLDKIFHSDGGLGTYNDWNGWHNDESEAVRSRIVEIVRERIPRCTRFKDLQILCGYARCYTAVNMMSNSTEYLLEKRREDCAGLETLFDDQLVKIVSREMAESKMHKFHSFVAKYIPSRTLVLGEKRLPNTEKIFSKKIVSLLERDLPNMKSMKDFSAHLHDLCGADRFRRRFPNELKILIDGILEQVSGIKKTHFSLSEILYCYQLSQDKRLARVIFERIPIERDPQNLVCFNPDLNERFGLESYHFSVSERFDYWKLAKGRLKAEISRLAEPTEFFLECIEKKNFFDFKEVFVKKAKEFHKT